MNEIASFYATIGADTSGFKKGMEETRSAMGALQTGFGQLQDVAKTGLLAIGAAAVAMGASVATTGIQFNAMKEQAQVAFTTMLGSGLMAQNMLNELQAFAAKTPFEFPDLIRASQRLMAMGFAAQDVIPTLTAIGDAVAALGGTAETVDRVTTALGQMNAKGKASSEEMMQLTEAGIPAWQMLADKIGVSIPEAMKAVTAGTVTAGTAIAAITEGIESKFGGMMEKQSTTWNGLISNIKDGFAQMSGTIMQPFFDMAKGALENLSIGIGRVSDSLQKGNSLWNALGLLMANLASSLPVLSDVWVTFRDAMENAVAVIRVIAPPITDLISKFFKWQDVVMAAGAVIVSVLASIVIGFAPVIATAAALIVGIAALRHAWENDFLGIRTVTLNTFNKITDWFYNQSGIWQGTWEKTLSKLGNMIAIFWERKVYFAIRSWLIQTRDDMKVHLRGFEILWEGWTQRTWDTISGWVGDVTRTFTNWKDIMLTTYHDFADPVYRAVGMWVIDVRQKFTRMIDWIIKDFNDWKDWLIKHVFEPVLQWWADHIQPWIDKGREMVAGFWRGVQEEWGRFTNWFSGAWNGLVHRFQDFFGIHSPSKLFADYGENMMQGLAQGIGTGQNAVRGALDGMSAGLNANMTTAANYVLPSTGTQQTNANARMEQLLEILIAELRGKNMSTTVNVAGGGGGLGALVNTTNGLR